jgi:multiple antibiotic resistance protein
MEQLPSTVFTIFFLTLGPIKTIPVFYNLTREATVRFRQKAALESVLIALVACLLIGFLGRNVLGNWGVSLEALRLAGGLILLINALKIVTLQPPQPTTGKKITSDAPLSATTALAVSALTIPVIITPYGVVAILVFMIIVKDNLVLQGHIVAQIFLMMLLNYIGMIFASKIMSVIGMSVLRMIGWIFAIMQSALAIDIILDAFYSLGLIKQIS